MFSSLVELNFEPTVKNLLYGSTEHTEQVNIKVFEIIQNYIVNWDGTDGTLYQISRTCYLATNGLNVFQL